MFGILKRRKAKQINLKRMIQDGALLIDVRTAAEYNDHHAQGASHIPLEQIDMKAHKLKREQRPILAYCHSGRRSGIAVQRLKAYGIEAYNAGALKTVLAIT